LLPSAFFYLKLLWSPLLLVSPIFALVLSTFSGVLLLSTSPVLSCAAVVFTAVDVHEIHVVVKISDVAAFPAAVDAPYTSSVSNVHVVASVKLHAFYVPAVACVPTSRSENRCCCRRPMIF
jgi:hypothetical protein